MSVIHPDLLSVLQCPNSKAALQISGLNLGTVDRKFNYPFLSEIPWLFTDPDYFKIYWSNKKTEFTNFHKLSSQKIENEIKNNSLSNLTRQRLDILKKAHDLNYQTLSDLLKPLDNPGGAVPFEVGVPSHQSLHLYRKNLFRDWGWETDENQTGYQLVKDMFGSHSWQPEKFCVLGAGASRLAVDLHREFKLPMTVAVDFNPLLLLTAQKINQGHAIPLYDFANAPIEMGSVAKLYKLSSSQTSGSGFHLLFADVADLPIKSGSFQSVLTPWLIDILPMSFKLLAQRVNRILSIGGHWVNFGPMGFSHRQEFLNLTSEEVKEQLRECGFEIEAEKAASIKYLSANDEVNSRNETVFLFKVRKVKDVAVDDYDYWAPWLLDLDAPVPLSDEIKQHQQLVRFQGDLFHSIDGRLSINQIAKLFSVHYKLNLDAALKMTVNVLRQFDESTKRK